jgi:succinate dehydrogenase/fumarate reductase flavoprotein subunit
LLEGLVFGARAGRAMKLEGAGRAPLAGDEDRRPRGADAPLLPPIERIRDVMWRNVGLFREQAALQEAVDLLEEPWRSVDAHLRQGGAFDAQQWRAANLLTVARLIARAALRREESRGAHYRDDFPRRDDINWNRRVTETIDQQEQTIGRPD